MDELTEFVSQYGAKGLAYLAIGEDKQYRSSFTKFMEEERVGEVIQALAGEEGDLLLFVADQPQVVYEALGRLRLHLGDQLGLRDPNLLAWLWVIDFPFFTWNEDESRWDPSHHPFTSPMMEDVHFLETDPGKARGQQYDMVLNGLEVGGGSIRIHDRKLQEIVFKLIGLDPEVARERFGHLLEAFEYGTPPHGGIAPGIDRLVRIFAGEDHIREVIAFPKNQAARDVMAGAPSPAEKGQLAELHIRVIES